MIQFYCTVLGYQNNFQGGAGNIIGSSSSSSSSSGESKEVELATFAAETRGAFVRWVSLGGTTEY